MYKPVTLTADFRQSDGTPFVGTVAFTVANSRGSKSYTYTGTPVTVTTITNSTTGPRSCSCPAVYTITVTNQAAASFYTDVVTQNLPETLLGLPDRSHCDRDRHGRPARHDQRHRHVGVRGRPGQRRDRHGLPAARARSRRGRRRRTRAASRPSRPPCRLGLHRDRGEGRRERSQPDGLRHRRLDQQPHVRLPDGSSQGQVVTWAGVPIQDAIGHALRRPRGDLALRSPPTSTARCCSRTSRPAPATR